MLILWEEEEEEEMCVLILWEEEEEEEKKCALILWLCLSGFVCLALSVSLSLSPYLKGRRHDLNDHRAEEMIQSIEPIRDGETPPRHRLGVEHRPRRRRR